jgi:hypothetical protein
VEVEREVQDVGWGESRARLRMGLLGGGWAARVCVAVAVVVSIGSVRRAVVVVVVLPQLCLLPLSLLALLRLLPRLLQLLRVLRLI